MRSRVREFHLPLTIVFGGAALVGLILCGTLGLAGIDLGLNLSLVGLLLGLLIPLGIEIRSRSGRIRKVVVLDYRRHQYGHAVARGAIRSLGADKRRWDVKYKGPETSTTKGAFEWQIREIQSAVIEDVDAIVLIPAGDDEALWFAVASAIKSRTFVVVVDTKPPNRVFRDVGIEPPRFVSTRYAETGVVVGSLLSDWLREDVQRRCVLWVGPWGSWPGEERSRNVIFELSRNGLLDRSTMLPLESWTPDAQQCRETLNHVDKCDGETAVYTADDENAVALHLLTIAERPALRPRMFIVGCNGTPDDWGGVPAVDMRAVDATVDILAEEQGVQAAMLMVRERNAKLMPSERSVFIRPHTILASSESGRWIDGLFQNEGRKSIDVDSADTEVDAPS